MRIAIITLPLHTNYGGILQAYALQRILEQAGHDATLIDDNPYVKLPSKTRFLIYLKRAFLRYFLRKEIEVFPDIAQNRRERTKRKNTSKFIEKHIKKIAIKNVQEINELDYDGYVVGSDQIWRCIYNRYFPGTRNAFLEFAKNWNVKRIAYAASFGTDKWEYTPEDTAKCEELAKKFDAISVREKSAVKICKEKFEVNAAHLIDPTMLLTSENYIKLFQEAGTPKSEGDLMCYLLDKSQEANELIDYISNKKQLTPFHTNSEVENEYAKMKERIQPPVESWIRGFYDAKFIITDSFHACVFSILFKKPFIVLGNKKRGMPRFISLLQAFNLTERLVADKKEAESIIDKSINWENVEKQLVKHRKEALHFLHTHL